MLNDRFVVRQSEHFAERLQQIAPNDLSNQVTAAYTLALNRDPSEKELAELRAYTEKFGLPNLCRAIFNSNEFIFIN